MQCRNATKTNSQPATMSGGINNADLRALQAYVQAADATQYDGLAQDTVLLDLTHSNLRQRHAEIRFDLHDTIGDLRQRVHQKSGTPPQYQRLLFLRGNAVESGILHDVAPGADDDKMLGYYSPTNGMTVHCIDTDPHSGSRGGRYEDTSLVEKYRMTDEEYDKRKGTLRDWGRRQREADPSFNLACHAREHRELMEVTRQVKLGYPLPEGYEMDAGGKVKRVEKENEVNGSGSAAAGAPTSASAAAASAAAAENNGPQTVEGIAVGDRCEIQPGGRRGTVAFVGEVPEIGGGGHWVGVTFDEPVGKTDGTVRGGAKRYFDAGGANMGGFARGKNVTVGDYPERDIMDELDSGSDSEDEL